MMNSGNSNNPGQQQLSLSNVNSSTIPHTTGSAIPADAEALRLYYEEVLRSNPNNIQAVYYLAIWYLERQSYHQVSTFLPVFYHFYFISSCIRQNVSFLIYLH
jgi:hypothetical protein